VARILVEPNSANVVPACVTIAAEIRAGDNGLLEEAAEAAQEALAAAAAYAGVSFEIVAKHQRQVRDLPAGPALLVCEAAQAAGISWRNMDTVAGHDALSLLGLCPIGLIFVPSIGGISHNEREDTAQEDIEAGLTISLLAVSRLCRAPQAALGVAQG
jgi:N-carbamoyl-L-amino-acid hydrolase